MVSPSTERLRMVREDENATKASQNHRTNPAMEDSIHGLFPRDITEVTEGNIDTSEIVGYDRASR